MTDPTGPSEAPGPERPANTGDGERVIRIDFLARVEGEGAMTVRLRDGKVHDVQLRFFEAPRFFEGLLRGRPLQEAPDITARVCGICPVAYQMSACHAMEQVVGIEVGGALRDLRRLLYCGEWIESHALSIYFLQAPDYLGYESAVAMAQARPEYARLVGDALRLKKAGNAIVALLGGREIHPINVRVGGFYRVPTKRELGPLSGQLRDARELARQTVRWAAGLPFPRAEEAGTAPVEHGYEFVSLRHAGEYPMNEGRIVSSRGLDIGMGDFRNCFEEYQVPYSTALHCRRKPENGAAGGGDPTADGTYFVGSLARWNLNHDLAGPAVRQAAADTGIAWPCRNAYAGIVTRSLEVLYAVEHALELIERYEPPGQPAVPWRPRAGTGAWATEAPRGMLYHAYETDDQGRIAKADIIPPTSQNQRQIEQDLARFVPSVLHLDEAEAALRCEQVVRNYDPCISCSTHFLKLKVEHL